MACRARISEIRPESRSAAPNVSIWPSPPGDVTNYCPRGSAWWMAGPAWRTMSWRMLGCNAGCGSAQHGGAARCRGQQLRAAASLSSSVWLTAAAFAIVSSDMTAHASCFHEGLLRIALWSPDACCWSLSSCVPAEGGYIRWYAMSLAACCVICAKKLRGGQPNPVWAWAWVTGPSVRPSVSMSVRPSRCPSVRPTVRSPHGDGDGHGHGHGHGRLSAKW